MKVISDVKKTEFIPKYNANQFNSQNNKENVSFIKKRDLINSTSNNSIERVVEEFLYFKEQTLNYQRFFNL